MPSRRAGAGWTTALVEGPSMLPTLRPGDALLVGPATGVRAGSLVVARPLAAPELLVVKRAVLDLGGGTWEVEADNPEVVGRGWTGGPADVVGRVRLRYWPLPPTRSFPPPPPSRSRA